jgi:tight adherence protein C
MFPDLSLVLLVVSAALFAACIADLAPWRRRAVLRKLSELETYDPTAPARPSRGPVWENIQGDVMSLLRRMGGSAKTAASMEGRLRMAGFRHPQMAAIYRGACTASMLLFAALFMIVAGVINGKAGSVIVLGIYGALLGWLAPRWYIGRAVSARHRNLQRALPDALDLMVVCVEAGLGLNQALRRVAQEIGSVSPALGDELTLVNLEIRAGASRLDALKSLGERTGLDDLRALAAMLVQTERFGTPVADALRSHADALRTKRRQRAEEAAAKTTVKLLFPLVLFIFPPLYLVILGPAVLMMIRAMSGTQ